MNKIFNLFRQHNTNNSFKLFPVFSNKFDYIKDKINQYKNQNKKDWSYFIDDTIVEDDNIVIKIFSNRNLMNYITIMYEIKSSVISYSYTETFYFDKELENVVLYQIMLDSINISPEYRRVGFIETVLMYLYNQMLKIKDVYNKAIVLYVINAPFDDEYYVKKIVSIYKNIEDKQIYYVLPACNFIKEAYYTSLFYDSPIIKKTEYENIKEKYKNKCYLEKGDIYYIIFDFFNEVE